ncbi:hypothetical protein [Veronia pacifica]|uniref:Uncharacterized protein n=1 Tax=Veronia pacifica TaxID=1080227 RepID=A0A1C3EEB1_9GAMM|nr:hypothetical protein [Veronia pacifica]ODA31592.1 hypothetical protein A8L45_16435 [Veronia pacifica]
MKINIHVEQLELTEKATYGEVYRAMYQAIQEHWPVMHAVSPDKQALAQQQAAATSAKKVLALRQTGRAR